MTLCNMINSFGGNMKKNLTVLFSFSMLFWAFLFGSQSNQLQEEEETYLELDWKLSGTYQLPNSNSTLLLPEGYQLLMGDEAQKALILQKESANEDIEALVYDISLEDIVYFSYINTGYISLEDWREIDPKQLLESISENTENANKERRKNGIEEIHVVGWIQEPTLDRVNNTVFWAIEGKDDNDVNFVNSIALRLSREGFEKLNWVTSKRRFKPFGGDLEVMLNSHNFNPGYRYSDYISGDKVAQFGIAALVAASVGGKIIKSGGLILLLKKFCGLIFAAIAALFYKLKKYFKK